MSLSDDARAAAMYGTRFQIFGFSSKTIRTVFCLSSDRGARAWIDEAQRCPLGEVRLVVVPVGTPGGHSSNQTIIIFLGPYKAPKGTNTEVTSAKGPCSAYPIRGTNKKPNRSGWTEPNRTEPVKGHFCARPSGRGREKGRREMAGQGCARAGQNTFSYIKPYQTMLTWLNVQCMLSYVC